MARPLLHRATEHFTVWTLFVTVALFSIGKISQIHYQQALGIHGIHLEIPWQDYVFSGGAGLLDMLVGLLQGNPISGLFLLPLASMAAGIWAYGRCDKSPRWGRFRRWLRPTAILLTTVGSLVTLLGLSIHWGRQSATFLRDHYPYQDHFVFQPECVATLSRELVEDNAKGALKVVLRTPDTWVLLGSNNQTIHQVAARAILLHTSTTAPGNQEGGPRSR